MKVLICEKPGSFKYETRKYPVIEKGNAIIKVKRIGICGTDIHAYDGTQPYFQYPRILGHELAGIIEEIEENSNLKKGDKVTVIPYFGCGKCIACRNGLENCCVKINVFGVHIDGGMCEYISVPLKYLLQGNDMHLDELALVEPLAIGAHGVKRTGVKQGEFVLVIGAGPIGIGVMEFAKIAKANVIAMDVNKERLDFCSNKLGLVNTINAAKDNVIEKLKDITNGDMPTVVIDATGNLNAINTAFQYMAHGGRFVLVGLQKNEIVISHPEFHKREATLMSSRNANRSDFEFVQQSIRNKVIDPLQYITYRENFDKIGNTFPILLKPGSGVIKAMVEY